MKKLLYLLILLPLTVFADHHKQQALDYLDIAEQYAANTVAGFEYMDSANEWTPEQQFWVEHLRAGVYRMQSKIDLSRFYLNKDDPKNARRWLNQPNRLGFESAMLLSTRCDSWITEIARLGNDDALLYSETTRQISYYWQKMSLALWHVNDAITEEAQ